jgi:hypothetical protein
MFFLLPEISSLSLASPTWLNIGWVTVFPRKMHSIGYGQSHVERGRERLDETLAGFIFDLFEPTQHLVYALASRLSSGQIESLRADFRKEYGSPDSVFEEVSHLIPPEQFRATYVPGGQKHSGRKSHLFENGKSVGVVVAVPVVESYYQRAAGPATAFEFALMQILKRDDLEVAADEFHLLIERLGGGADERLIERKVSRVVVSDAVISEHAQPLRPPDCLAGEGIAQNAGCKLSLAHRFLSVTDRLMASAAALLIVRLTCRSPSTSRVATV